MLPMTTIDAVKVNTGLVSTLFHDLHLQYQAIHGTLTNAVLVLETL